MVKVSFTKAYNLLVFKNILVKKHYLFILSSLLCNSVVFAESEVTVNSCKPLFPLVNTIIIALLCACVGILSTLLIVLKRSRNSKICDSLTGLSTTYKFLLDARQVLINSRPGEYSVISLDINSFRYITESFGRNVGNEILKELGKHFIKTVPEGTLICRNYSDNFSFLINVTLLPILEDIVISLTDIKSSVEKVLPQHFNIEFSAGVYEIKNPYENVETMLEKANSARKSGKSSVNPKRIAVFTDKMADSIEQERDMLFDMQRAFENNEFEVYYQPKFNFSNGKIIGAEALVRWNHKEKGLLQPGAFVPLFERNGFIEKIDVMVFESVCKFLDNWNKNCTNSFPITISCNLSRVQLYNPDVAKIYKQIVSNYQIAPSAIEIELTESLMMDNKDRLLRAMNEIKKAGFSISIDDFGSGFSSLSLLKDIPANVIKLDKEFLNSDLENKKEHIIINSVIDMAKSLDMTTVAEGVEDKEQSDLLKEMGCDIVQGFFYAKPMPEADFSSLLNRAVS